MSSEDESKSEPVYKQAWFWPVMIGSFVVVFGVGGIALAGYLGSRSKAKSAAQKAQAARDAEISGRWNAGRWKRPSFLNRNAPAVPTGGVPTPFTQAATLGKPSKLHMWYGDQHQQSDFKPTRTAPKPQFSTPYVNPYDRACRKGFREEKRCGVWRCYPKFHIGKFDRKLCSAP